MLLCHLGNTKMPKGKCCPLNYNDYFFKNPVLECNRSQ